jgi:hypothetical protein
MLAMSFCTGKTKIDWAQEVKILLEEDFPDAKKVILVCDNLNTHSLGSFGEVIGTAIGDGADAEAWQLVEHCRERVVGVDGSMCERASFWYDGGITEIRSDGVGGGEFRFREKGMDQLGESRLESGVAGSLLLPIFDPEFEKRLQLNQVNFGPPFDFGERGEIGEQTEPFSYRGAMASAV